MDLLWFLKDRRKQNQPSTAARLNGKIKEWEMAKMMIKKLWNIHIEWYLQSTMRTELLTDSNYKYQNCRLYWEHP